MPARAAMARAIGSVAAPFAPSAMARAIGSVAAPFAPSATPVAATSRSGSSRPGAAARALARVTEQPPFKMAEMPSDGLLFRIKRPEIHAMILQYLKHINCNGAAAKLEQELKRVGQDPPASGAPPNLLQNLLQLAMAHAHDVPSTPDEHEAVKAAAVKLGPCEASLFEKARDSITYLEIQSALLDAKGSSSKSSSSSAAATSKAPAAAPPPLPPPPSAPAPSPAPPPPPQPSGLPPRSPGRRHRRRDCRRRQRGRQASAAAITEAPAAAPLSRLHHRP